MSCVDPARPRRSVPPGSTVGNEVEVDPESRERAPERDERERSEDSKMRTPCYPTVSYNTQRSKQQNLTMMRFISVLLCLSSAYSFSLTSSVRRSAALASTTDKSGDELSAQKK